MDTINAQIPLSGVTIGDLQNQSMNAMKMREMQQQMYDQDIARKQQMTLNQIYQTSDVSTPEGVAALQQKIGRINPELALKVGKEYAQTGEFTARTKKELASAAESEEKLKGEKLKSDTQRLGQLSNAAATVVSVYDEEMKRSKNPASAMAKAQATNTYIINELAQNGIITPEQSKQMMSQPLDIEKVRATSQQMTSAHERMKQQLDESKQSETKRHNITEEGLRSKELEIRKDKVEKIEKARSSFEGENGDLMAALAERGVSLPAGFRSKEQQIALLNGLRSRNPGVSTDELADRIASGQVEFGANKAAARTAGGVAGKIAYAEKEIENIAPLVMESSKKVPRGSFVPWNKLKQYSDTQLSDPNLKELHAYMQTLSNSYDMLAARGGTDKDKRAENRKLFDTADSPETLQRVVQVMMNEAKASGKAAKESIRSVSGRDSSENKSKTTSHPDDINELLKKYGK